MGDVRVEAASDADMVVVEAAVRRLRLDDENLRREQFLVLRDGGRLVAFGRIKPYEAAFELGCVAVLETARGRALGARIVDALVQRFPTDDVWITTDLTTYFERLGFRAVEGGPPELVAKIARISGRLRSGVVVMHRRR